MYTGEDNLKTAYVNLKWRYQEGSWKIGLKCKI